MNRRWQAPRRTPRREAFRLVPESMQSATSPDDRRQETTMPSPIETTAMRKVFARLIPLLFAMMFFNYLDRINIGFAALDMNHQLGFDPAVFGFAGSIFFAGYMLLEVPSNLLLQRF